MDFQVSLKVILKNNKGEILLLKMLDEGSMPGYYDFPGGRVRRNEIKTPLEKIIRREMREELGKDVRFSMSETPVALGRHWYFSKVYKKDQHLFWIFFEARYKGGAIKISSEHKGYAWTRLTKKNYRKYFIRGPLQGAYNYLFKKLPLQGK